jgi:dolichyl-phosphate-mannose-protein mannosyltransferase
MATGAGSLPLPPARGQPRAVQVTGALIALMILGTLLRWHRLGYQSFWNDEIVTWLSAQGSAWNVITQRIENSNIPPLYYLIAHAALPLRGRLGLEEAMRLPSVVAGVLSIPLLYIVARAWIGSRIALLAAALLTVSPFHVWYSQEARPYVVLLLAALVALACAQQALEYPDRGSWKAAFALAAAATFYLHTVGAAFIGFTVFYIVIAAAVPDASASGARQAGSRWAAWRAGIRAAGMTYWRSWTLTFIGVALLCIPAVYRLASFPPTNSADAERPFSPVQFGYALWSFGVGYSYGPSLGDLHAANRAAIILHDAWQVVPAGAALIGLYALGTWWLARWRPRALWYAGLWFVFPMLFATLGALVTVHPFNVRYAVISFLPALIVLACGIDALPSVGARAIAWVGVVCVSALALTGYYNDPRYARDDYRGAAAFLTAHAGRGDIVIAHRAFTARDLRFYARPFPVQIIGFPITSEPLDSAQTIAALASTIGDAPHLWLFLSRGTPEEDGPLAAYCESHFRRTYTYTSTGVRLIAYERDSVSTPAAVAPPPPAASRH